MNWFVDICDFTLIFNGICTCGLRGVGLRKGRKALRDPPPTKTVADGREYCLDSLFIVSIIGFDVEPVVFGNLIFDDTIFFFPSLVNIDTFFFFSSLVNVGIFLFFSSLVNLIWRDGRDFFGLGGTTATGGTWCGNGFCCVERGILDWDGGKLWLRTAAICWGCLNCGWCWEWYRGGATKRRFDIEISMTGWIGWIAGGMLATCNRCIGTKIKYLNQESIQGYYIFYIEEISLRIRWFLSMYHV